MYSININGEWLIKVSLVLITLYFTLDNQSHTIFLTKGFLIGFIMLLVWVWQVFTPLTWLTNESLASRSPFSNRDVLGLQMSLARSNRFLSFMISCISELASGVADGLFTHGLVCFGLYWVNWLALSIVAVAAWSATENHTLELLVAGASRVKSFSSVSSSLQDISWTALNFFRSWSTSRSVSWSSRSSKVKSETPS